MNTKFDRGWRIKALVVLGALALLALGVGLASADAKRAEV